MNIQCMKRAFAVKKHGHGVFSMHQPRKINVGYKIYAALLLLDCLAQRMRKVSGDG